MTIREHRAVAAGDVEIGLVQKGGGAEGHAVSAARELAAGEPVQLRVQRAEQGFRCGSVAAFGGGDEGGNGCVHGQPVLVILS